jgi:hypothetical protein
MLSGRLDYRCQVFPVTVSRTLVILEFAYAKSNIVRTFYAGVADTLRRRGGGVSWTEGQRIRLA